MEDREGPSQLIQGNFPAPAVPVTPAGLEAIYTSCRRLYPDQPNPLQVTAVVKYWLNGPDPLDYISMYSNPGLAERGIPAHWHYISYGLSDLHGDARVHECSGSEGPSGFGFELTFRLKREPGEKNPPTWPAALMQSLARYVFQSENTLCSGDHVSWHAPLDNSESRIQHMLMTDDPQLMPMCSPFGSVAFVQIVGVCEEELKASQHWNGPGIIDLLQATPLAGGPWLITDMRRGETVFEIDPSLQDRVDAGIELEGSNLSGVSSRCSWEQVVDLEAFMSGNSTDEDKENKFIEGDRRSSSDMERPCISDFESEQIKAALKKGLCNTKLLPTLRTELRDNIGIGDSNQSNHSTHSTQSNHTGSRKESFDSTISSDGPSELLRTRTLEGVNLKFNIEAGSLMLLALRGRLKHGRHFTFKSVVNDAAITLVSSSVIGSIADEQHPYAAHGPWLQVLFTDDFIQRLIHDLDELHRPDEIACPKTYCWPDKRLTITILADEM